MKQKHTLNEEYWLRAVKDFFYVNLAGDRIIGQLGPMRSGASVSGNKCPKPFLVDEASGEEFHPVRLRCKASPEHFSINTKVIACKAKDIGITCNQGVKQR